MQIPVVLLWRVMPCAYAETSHLLPHNITACKIYASDHGPHVTHGDLLNSVFSGVPFFLSCLQLYNTPVLQKAHAEKGGPHVHGIVFDVGEGLVKELDVDFKSLIQK